VTDLFDRLSPRAGADLRANPSDALELLRHSRMQDNTEHLASCLRRLLFSWHPSLDVPVRVRDGFVACLLDLGGHPNQSVQCLALMLAERLRHSSQGRS
jgi:hypothetical protein